MSKDGENLVREILAALISRVTLFFPPDSVAPRRRPSGVERGEIKFKRLLGNEADGEYQREPKPVLAGETEDFEAQDLKKRGLLPCRA
jgi:hypothetical protein